MQSKSGIGRRAPGLRSWLLAAALVAAPAPGLAVILDGTNECTVKLSDGTDVVLIGEFRSKLGTRAVDAEPPPTMDRLRAPFLHTLATRSTEAMRNKELGDLRKAAEEGVARLRNQWQAPPFTEAKKSNRFYYLPPGNSVHLSTRPNGVPEFLFVKYTTEERADAGGVSGALMHFLMEWSLTPDQEAELRQKVARECRVDTGGGLVPGELVGHVPLDERSEQGSFQIISATLSDDGLARSVVQSGHAPTMPGGKIAAAANLSKEGAQLFMSTLEKARSVADLSVELDFNYQVMYPAAKARLVISGSKMREMRRTYEMEEKLTKSDSAWIFWGSTDTTVSRDEVASALGSMIANKVARLEIEEYQPDSEVGQQIRKAMTEMFESLVTQPLEGGEIPTDALDELTADVPEADREGGLLVSSNALNLFGYRSRSQTLQINKDYLEQFYVQEETVIEMDAGLTVRRPVAVVGNLASWYDGVKDNQDCVVEVNLNDPFFQHREIRFILDLDAKEIFEDMVNYVTINARKKRSGDANDFEQSVTIDADYLRNKGVAASMTYARMSDRGSETYEYMTQWSLKGGNLFPATPRWQRGVWEGVTLSPPIERWYVEVEGDLEEMAASDIARVTAELHYPLFGQEHFEVIPLSVSSGQALMGEHIYVDRGTRGFAYRLIVHHKKEGRMVLPWQTRIGDRYVYATIPPEILAAGKPREQAKLAAQKLGKVGTDKVLDQFQELFADAD